METQAVAAYLASEFNKVKPSSAKTILFIEVSVVQAEEKDGTPIFYNVEKLLPDYKMKFTKWCNNTGNYLFYQQFLSEPPQDRGWQVACQNHHHHQTSTTTKPIPPNRYHHHPPGFL